MEVHEIGSTRSSCRMIKNITKKCVEEGRKYPEVERNRAMAMHRPVSELLVILRLSPCINYGNLIKITGCREKLKKPGIFMGILFINFENRGFLEEFWDNFKFKIKFFLYF